MPSTQVTQQVPSGIDPRGPQFNAALTVVVLAAVLLTAPGPAGIVLIALQTVLFALGAIRGVQRTPAAWLFRTIVRPRLAPPSHTEDPRPPRFAQGVGLAFTSIALVSYVVDASIVGAVATGLALVAALLNAVFGFCLGCEMYLIGQRLLHRSTPATTDTASANKTDNEKKEAFA